MVNLAMAVGLISAFVLLVSSPFLLVLIGSFLVVILIVFGERFKFEEQWEGVGLPGREFLFPIILLSVFMFQGLISADLLQSVVIDKLPIIALILSFAIISNGFSRSGFFEWAAYKIVEKCAGDTKRLIIYMFIVSSVLTFFTSNDIVVLTLTPIIFSICVHARIKNAKLLFLSQFVAANTLAMGLLIGSPTNIIVSEAINLDFLNYFFLMVIPAVFSFFATITVIEFINLRSRPGPNSKNLFSRFNWEYFDSYRVPARAPWSEFTPGMARWLYLFLFGVVGLIFTTSFDVSLYFACVPIVLGSILLTIFEVYVEKAHTNTIESPQNVLLKTVFTLPYGIIGFAIAYFTFARFLAGSDFLHTVVVWVFNLAETNPLLAGPAIVFGTGISVNILNDLPAAALIGEVLQYSPAADETTSDLMKRLFVENSLFDRLDSKVQSLILQAILVGLNVGCYVTPVGALAGIIWFNQMRLEKRRHQEFASASDAELGVKSEAIDIVTPSRKDLVLYGGIAFIYVTILIGLFIPFFALLVELLAAPVDRIGNLNLPLGNARSIWTVAIGVIVTTVILRNTTKLIGKNKVALSHISEVFVVLNKVAIWSLRNRVLYTATIFLVIIAVSGGLLVWVEGISIDTYGSRAITGRNPENIPRSLVGFYSWFFVFVGSTFERSIFPQSILSHILLGVMPLTAIAAVLTIVRSTSNETLQKLREALGSGEIPHYRMLVVNFQPRFQETVLKLLETPSAFVVLVCRDRHTKRAQIFVKSLLDQPQYANRILVRQMDEDPYSTLRELDFPSANEIFFLTDMTIETDIDNMRMLTRVDAWMNEQRIAASMEIEEMSIRNPELRGTNRGYGEFLGVPKIYFETGTERQATRVRSTLSELLNYQTIVTSFDDVVAPQLIADCFGELDSQNDRFSFGEYASIDEVGRSVKLFATQSNMFAKMSLADLELDEHRLAILREFFVTNIESKRHENQALRSHSLLTRQELPSLLESLMVDSDVGSIRVQDIVGVRCKIGSRRFRMDLASACSSSQSITIDGLVVLQREGTAKLDASTKLGAQQNIFIFNMNPLAESFLSRLVASTYFDRVNVLVILGKNQSLDASLTRYENIVAVNRRSVDHSVELIVGKGWKSSNQSISGGGDEFAWDHSLGKGDSVLVFTDYEREHESNIEIIEFIEALDFIVSDAELKGTGARRDDLYTAVEASDEETRFLFEHLAIDKFIDSTELRVSYLSQAADFYHGMIGRMQSDLNEKSNPEVRWGQFHRTIFNFRRAFDYADRFKSVRAELASGQYVVDDQGIRQPVVGMSFSKACHLLMTKSSPAVQLISVCQLEVIKYSATEFGEFGIGPQLRQVQYDKDYVIKNTDLLVMLPII